MSWARNLKASASALRSRLAWFAGAPIRNTVAANSAKYAYPEKLIIYQDGTARVALVALTQLFALSPFAFATYHYTWPELQEGNRLYPLMITSIFFIPIPIIAVSTRSFVFSIFLKPPPTARVSAAALNNWLTKLPRTAEVSFQAPGGFFGVPVTKSFQILDLCTIRQRIGRIANFSTVKARNKLFAYGQHFHVRSGMEDGSKKVTVRNVWPKVAKMIKEPPKWK